MTYRVRVAVEHPAFAPYQVEREGEESNGPELISLMLLQALAQVQQHIGVRPTSVEVSAAAMMLDELGVIASPSLSDRVCALANEVIAARNTIREVRAVLNVGAETPDSKLGDIAHAFRVAGEQRRATDDTERQRWQQALNRVRLDLGLQMIPIELTDSKSELEQVRGLVLELSAAHSADPEKFAGHLAPVRTEQLAHMMFLAAQEVSAQRGTEPIPLTGSALWEEASRGRRSWWLDVAERTLAWAGDSISVPTGVLPVRAEELAQAMHDAFGELGDSVHTMLWVPWEESEPRANERRVRIAQRVLDSLPSFTAPKSAMPPVTPQQLARAMHKARSAVTLSDRRPVFFLPVEWERLQPQAREWFEAVAEIALSELPEIARADAEADERFAAHTDASLAELRGGIDELAGQNRDLTYQVNAALSALEEIAWILGMTFEVGEFDRLKSDARALGELVATAVRRVVTVCDGYVRDLDAMREERDRLKTAEFELFEALVSVAHMLGLAPAGSPRTFLIRRVRDAVRMLHGPVVGSLREIAKTLGMSFGDSENVGTIGAMTLEAVRQAVADRDGNFRALADARRKIEELLVAGNDANSDMHSYRGMVMWVADELGLSADVVDDPKRFGDAVRAELETWKGRPAGLVASWADLAHTGKPGMFFSVDPGSGEVRQGRAFKLDEGSVKAAFGRVSGSIETDRVAVADLVNVVSGGVLPSALDRRALLEQLRVLGQHVQRLEAGKVRRDARFMRLREITGLTVLSGSTEDELVDSIAGRYTDFNDRMPELIRENETLWTRIEAADLRARETVARMERELGEALGEFPPDDDSDDTWGDMIVKVGDLVADHESDQETSIAVAQEEESFRRSLAATLGAESMNKPTLLGYAQSLAAFQREHRACQVAAALGRDHNAQLREALDSKSVSWSELLADARSLSATLAETRVRFTAQVAILEAAQRTIADRAQDLKRALGLGSDESWEDMIEIVTGRTSRADADQLEVNALAAIREVLGLHPKMFPAGVVEAVRDLRTSWGVMEEWYPRVVEALGVTYDTTADENIPTAVGKALDKIRAMKSFANVASIPGSAAEVKRVRDAVGTLLEAAGIDLEEDFTRPDVTVQKAGDAAAILRSWPDVVRTVAEFDGDEVEQPDEVAPMLMNFVPLFHRADEDGSRLRALERLFAAHAGTAVADDAWTSYERWDNLVNRLFAVVEEVGRQVGLRYVSGDGKAVFADNVLTNIRNHAPTLPSVVPAEVLRGLSRFDIGEPATLAEVESLLEGYAKAYHAAGRYQAVLHNLEIMLSTLTGEPKKFNDETLKQRFGDFVDDVFEVVLEAGRQAGVAFEANGSKRGYAKRVAMVVRSHVALNPVPMWASFTEQIASRFESMVKLRPDAEDPDFLVFAELPPLHKQTLLEAAIMVRAHGATLVSGQQVHPLVMALQDGAFWAPGGEFSKGTESDLELLPDADGGVMLRETVADGHEPVTPFRVGPSELAPVGAALLALSYHRVRENGLRARREERQVDAVRLSRVPQEWCYGPNAIDPDPGKRWHIGCGGEVLTFEGVDVCGDCKYEWPPDVELSAAVEAAEQQQTVVAEPDQDSAP